MSIDQISSKRFFPIPNDSGIATYESLKAKAGWNIFTKIKLIFDYYINGTFEDVQVRGKSYSISKPSLSKYLISHPSGIVQLQNLYFSRDLIAHVQSKNLQKVVEMIQQADKSSIQKIVSLLDPQGSVQHAFYAWVDTAEKNGHFTAGNVQFIKSQFTRAFADQNKSQEQAKNDFLIWARKATAQGHFTPGNLKRIEQKLNELVQEHAHRPSVAPVAQLSNFASTGIPIKQIEAMAARDGFVAFYNNQTMPVTECFGNFFMKDFVVDNVVCKCAEAHFQRLKFPGNHQLQSQFSSLDGDSAWRLAQAHKGVQRSDWLQVNLGEMRRVLEEKYKDPELRAALLATGDAYLVEHTPVKGRDSYWADDSDGSGKNMLGILLMEIRGKLGGKAGVVHPTPGYLNKLPQ